MSFDLAVLAMDSSADATAALAMFGRCNRRVCHDEGEIDGRVIAFCDALAAQFPLDDPNSRWMMTPSVGIDHVIMHLSWSRGGAAADDFGISPVSIAEIPHLVERSASRWC